MWEQINVSVVSSSHKATPKKHTWNYKSQYSLQTQFYQTFTNRSAGDEIFWDVSHKNKWWRPSLPGCYSRVLTQEQGSYTQFLPNKKQYNQKTYFSPESVPRDHIMTQHRMDQWLFLKRKVTSKTSWRHCPTTYHNIYDTGTSLHKFFSVSKARGITQHFLIWSHLPFYGLIYLICPPCTFLCCTQLLLRLLAYTFEHP